MWMLTGCASGMLPTQDAPQTVVPRLAASVPEVLLMSCEPLPKVKSGKLQALMENHIETTHRYHECAERHDALAAVVRTMQQHSRQTVIDHRTLDDETGQREQGE